jgi:hypothetical protein
LPAVVVPSASGGQVILSQGSSGGSRFFGAGAGVNDPDFFCLANYLK